MRSGRNIVNVRAVNTVGFIHEAAACTTDVVVTTHSMSVPFPHAATTKLLERLAHRRLFWAG